MSLIQISLEISPTDEQLKEEERSLVPSHVADAELLLATAPGNSVFDPSEANFDNCDLTPKPVAKKAKKVMNTNNAIHGCSDRL